MITVYYIDKKNKTFLEHSEYVKTHRRRKTIRIYIVYLNCLSRLFFTYSLFLWFL